MSPENARIPFLVRGPVLRTLAGARQRVKRLTLEEMFQLTAHFDCNINQLHRRLWTGPKRVGAGPRGRPIQRKKGKR